MMQNYYSGTAAILRTPFSKNYDSFKKLIPIFKNQFDSDLTSYHQGVRQWISWEFYFDGTEIEMDTGKNVKLSLYKTHGPGVTSERAYVYDYVAKKFIFDSAKK